jgi:heptosyltransferase-1
VRVLLVHLGPPGDVLPALPVVHDIRVAFPEARIDWVAEPAAAGLLRRVDGVQAVHEATPARWRAAWWKGGTRTEWRALRERLRREVYDVVIDLEGSTASAVVARQARGLHFGPTERSDGAPADAIAGWLADQTVRIEPGLHRIDRARGFVAQVLARPLQGAPIYGLRADPGERRPGRPTVVVAHSGAGDASAWPVQSWVLLGKRLIGAGWNIALPQSNEAEQTRAELIAAGLQYEGQLRVEVWPALRLEALIDRLAGVQGVIGVDGMLSRLAAALELPHVQLHNGAATAARHGPLPAHGRAWQIAVEGRPAPALEAVWAAWNGVLAT